MVKTRHTIKFSIVIPFRAPVPFLYDCLESIARQSYQHYEIILLPDENGQFPFRKLQVVPTGPIGPAEKRDRGARRARGDVLVFIDMDAYPTLRWLEYMVECFTDSSIAAVCGPGVTPPNSSWRENASGWFSSSPLGGGTYTYRFLPYVRRFVDDYPSMNLAVWKSDFWSVGGFDTQYWPGEDTKLCLDLVHTLRKKIVYDPRVLVYHHRRPIWLSHLRQNGNYGFHRGYFAKALPKTSFRLVYFFPSFLVVGLLLLPIIVFPTYGLLLVANGFWVGVKSRSVFSGLISIPVVSVTHLWYGVRFIQGFLLTKQLLR